MTRLLKYILPATLVAGFLCSYSYLLLHHTFWFDDCFFDGLTRRYGPWKTYAICYEQVNGRWLGNFVSTLSFYLAGHNFTVYAVCLAVLALAFVSAAALLFRNFLRTFRQQQITLACAYFISLTFVATVYFMQYESRQEVWGWLSAAAVHVLSVTLSMLLFALLIKTENWNRRLLIFAIAFCLGGLNEVNAVCSFLLLAGIYFTRNAYSAIRLSRFSLLFAATAILLSLSVNLVSPGYQMRMTTLPDFNLLQSLKNTLHSVLMPFLEPSMITLIALFATLALTLLPLFAGQPAARPRGNEMRAIIFALGLALVSFFLNCYTLSDVVPARSAVWAYSLFAFVIFQQGLKYVPLTACEQASP